MSATDTSNSASRSWREALRVYSEPSTLRMFALGFSAGLRCFWCWARFRSGCARRASTARRSAT
jgi:hypothetical protein